MADHGTVVHGGRTIIVRGSRELPSNYVDADSRRSSSSATRLESPGDLGRATAQLKYDQQRVVNDGLRSKVLELENSLRDTETMLSNAQDELVHAKLENEHLRQRLAIANRKLNRSRGFITKFMTGVALGTIVVAMMVAHASTTERMMDTEQKF